MALDPLKFQVAIQDEATGQLDKIEQEFKKLQDKTINVKVEGLQDLRNLLSALQQKQVETLGKDVAAGIHDAAKGLQEEAQKAVRASLGQLAQDLVAVKMAIQNDNFTAFSTRIEKCAQAVNTLDAAFKQFHVTIGSDAGMKNFMTGLGEVIRNVRTTMGTLHGSDASKITPDAMIRSSKVAGQEVERLQNVLVRAQRVFETFGDKGFNVESLNRYKNALLEVRNNLDLIKNNNGQHPLTGLTASQYLSQEDVSRTKSLLNEELSLYRQIGTELERMTKLRNQLSETLKQNPNTSYVADIKNFIAGLDLRMGLVGRLGAQGGLTSMKLNSLFTDDYREQLAAVPQLLKAVTNEQKNNAQATKQAQSDNDRWAESIRRASVELPKLEMQIRSLQSLEKSSRAAGIDTTNLSAKITELQNLHRVLESIAGGAKLHGTAGDFINSAQYQNTVRFANEAAAAVRQTTVEKEKAARASQLLSSEEQRLAQALNHTTQAAHGQSQVLSDLKSMATQYLGVWGGQQFLHNIIEIGGQLEMQRLSIGAILQNTAHANELFDKIKGLATQSPFGVVQLDQMTKQLTAYGFKYNELYDMTKRLADISAATGTDVSRLALALGHVRSEAALSGYTLRQFSMGNIPLLQKLSEKLGKTSKEIRDMVKKKEIGYDDVLGVLKDLTNEGGMFYNMQEVISQSVKAKFKNVRDAMDIMYGEMAEGAPGEALKEVANVLMELTRNWKDVAYVMGSVAGVWALHRAAILTMNAALGSNTASVTANILAYKQKHAVELQNEALTRKLTAEELSLIATRKQITAANIRVALSTNAMTKGEALRLVGLRKLSLEEAKALIRSGQFTAAEVRMALQGRVLGMSLGYAGNMMRYFALQAKTAMVALLSNPWTWAMAGITAVVELWQRNNQELERAKELNDAIYERSQEGLKNTRTMMQNTGIRVDWKNDKNDQWNDVTGTFGQQAGGIMRFVKPDFEKNDDIEGTIEAWQQYIRDYAATPNRIINDAMTSSETVRGEDGIEKVTTKIREKREQYDLLYESVINVSRAQQQMASLGDAMEFAVNETNSGWFNEDLLTNIGDYDKEVKKVSQNIAKTYGDLRKYIDITIRKAQKEDENFAKATKGMDNYSQAFAHLVKNHEKYGKADEIFKDAHFGVSSAYEGLLDGGLFESGSMSGLENARKTMDEDLNQFFTSLDNQLRNQKGWHIDEVLAGKMTLSEDKQQALLSSWKDALSKVQGLTDETAHDLTQKFSERYHIQIDAATENAIVKVAQLEQSLNNLVNGDYKVSVETMTNAEAVFDKLKKDYKAAKSYIETSKPILAKFGISFTGKALSQEQINKALSKISDQNIRGEVAKILKGFNQAMGELGKTQEAANNIGLKLDDDKKKSGSTKKKSGTSKAYKDEFAKRWDERIRIMKEAYSWYDKWEKKVGNDAAINEVNAKYADIFAEWGEDKKLPMTFEGKDIKEYAKYVEQIRDDALNRYKEQTSTEANRKKYNGGQEALRVYRQAVALLNDVKFDNFVKAAEQFKSIIDQTIEDLNERWDIFDTIRNATGNVDIATRIAGFGAAETGARTSADAMRNELLSQLRSAGGENLLSKIPLDVNIDEEGLHEKFEKAIPQGEDAERYKEKMDGLIKAYQEWQKLQRKVIKDDVNVFANLIGSAVSYDAQIKKLQDKLKQQKDSINASVSAGTISQADADKANEIAQAQFDWEKVKLSADYANIYNNAIAMSREEFDGAAGAVERMLERLRELELISPNDYVAEKGKLDKARNEWSTTGFLGEKGAVGSFISGGNDGLLGYYAKRRDKARENAEREKNPEKKKKANEEAEHYGKLFQKLSKLSDAAKDVVTAFQTLQSGIDLVTNLFDSMGAGGAAEATSDAGGLIGGALQGASSLSALGPYGMAAGAALGLASGLFQLHDKGIQREIDALQGNVDALEENTKSIKAARERTLGYDNGALRKEMSKDYSNYMVRNAGLSKLVGYDIYQANEAIRNMYEYYSKNSNGSGYAAELANLKEQREDYIKMYNLESDKKKSSSDALDEYTQKIAELDDQIRFFSQDLAKELWDIDIKGWADQLSDALSSAFENGESVAKAYKETVTNILQQVMDKMMQMSILEPMFQNLQDKLFGNGKIKGVFDEADPIGSMSKVTAVISDFFGKGGEGEKTITAATEFMNAFQRGVQNAGLSVLNESSNSLSSGIQGTSEETSDLLAGYVNALRQDVAVNRILFTQFVTQLWPTYIEAFSAHVRTVANIDVNVQLMMEMMRDGNGAFFTELSSMRSRLDNVVDGIESLSVK